MNQVAAGAKPGEEMKLMGLQNAKTLSSEKFRETSEFQADELHWESQTKSVYKTLFSNQSCNKGRVQMREWKHMCFVPKNDIINHTNFSYGKDQAWSRLETTELTKV